MTTGEKLDRVFAPKSVCEARVTEKQSRFREFPRIPSEVNINGVRVSGAALIQILAMVTDPNPRRWYRFEREGDVITVHTKQD